MENPVLSQFPNFNLIIPAWQMGIFILTITACMLTASYKLSLVISYLFTFGWAFLMNWGAVIKEAPDFPMAAAAYIVLASLHLILTLMVFFRES